MKLIAMLGAGALAVGTLTAVATPAEAQRWGDRYDRGWHDNGRHHGWDRGDRGWDRGDRGRGWDRGYGYGYGRPYYGRSRVVCRIERGWYGPERRCFRVYR
ncbi:hypothetical protein D9601_04045 [Sphingomonas sp. MA1305]|uniref:hypothetical protein n=1 Tax=unclassified Sphingomonas TaxID=196159 RepID=UPI0018DF80E2|nr:hypothetical protein [Sphingomonas sp. MA1305]MBI0474534.1 hypothetical protein [Sphingomonas sp. MA1305]